MAKQTIHQLYHKESKEFFDVDPYDIVALKEFCIHLNEGDEKWAEMLEHMPHREKLLNLEQAGFEVMELEVTKEE